MSRASKPDDGSQRKLVIAFDIGITFSAVSYVFLIPHETPVIHSVTQFPGQFRVGGDSKIPSVVCYDTYGNVVAVGSETDVDTNPELLEVEGLVRAEWFKLHLRPARLVAEQGFDDKDLPALPRNKSVIDIFSDLLRYMYKSTKDHPNGWEGRQQSEIRHAAINADLVNANEAPERISFVTEGEANLHFCLNKIPDTFKKYANDGILVANCGEGTVDISSYARSKSMTSGSNFEEIAPAECTGASPSLTQHLHLLGVLQGSLFVTRRAQTFLTEKLHLSREPSKPHFIRFGRNEHDPEHDIRSGCIKLNGIDIAKFFEPTIKDIIKAIEKQTRKTTTRIRAICMVGTFATSDYLFSKLEDHFKLRGIDILRPDAPLNNAVAEGAIIFKMEPFVSSGCEAHHRLTKLQNGFDRLQEKSSRELRAAQDEFEALREQTDELKGLLDTQAVELTAASEFTFMTDQAQAELQALSEQTDELKRLVDTQAVGLTAAHEFTPMTDQVSAANVSRTVKDLNSTIYQTSIQLISIEQPAPATAPSASAADTERLHVQARIYSVGVIGERLLHLAQTVGQEDESFPILAFQSGIAHVCFSAISSWVYGRGHETQNEILNLAYEQIWANEKQPVAGHWRALTHKQLSDMSGDKVQREMHTLLSYLLISIGWKAEPRQIRVLLEEKLRECIDEIAALVSKASRMIREEFVSDDLQVIYVRAGQHFNPSLMDAEKGQASPEVQASVLGTVELGLALQNRAGGQQMLLKPRVALDTQTPA
ncbi:hypothetical protein F5887DRAFT_1259680 [Amanita rubescens]|nr:hypothetical protein F5887DRAFT_1259680 [Amanita rubescens]